MVDNTSFYPTWEETRCKPINTPDTSCAKDMEKSLAIAGFLTSVGFGMQIAGFAITYLSTAILLENMERKSISPLAEVIILGSLALSTTILLSGIRLARNSWAEYKTGLEASQELINHNTEAWSEQPVSSTNTS